MQDWSQHRSIAERILLLYAGKGESDKPPELETEDEKEQKRKMEEHEKQLAIKTRQSQGKIIPGVDPDELAKLPSKKLTQEQLFQIQKDLIMKREAARLEQKIIAEQQEANKKFLAAD